MKKVFIVKLCHFAALLQLTSVAARAADKYIVDPRTDDDWHTAANWTPAGVPATADNVGITRTYLSDPMIIDTGKAVDIQRLGLGQGVIAGTDYFAALNVYGALTNRISLYVGEKNGGRGRLLVDSGRVVTYNAAYVGNDNAQGVFIMTNGVNVTFGVLNVGVTNGAVGTVQWADSAAAVFGQTELGSGSGTQGTLMMTNTPFTCYPNTGGYGSGLGQMVVGNGGSGVLSQIGGSVTLNEYLTIGRLSGALGVYTNAGGTLTMNKNNLVVGNLGRGELQFRGGTVTLSSTSTLIIRANAAGAGLLQGWGNFALAGLAAPNYAQNNGVVVADGDGTERDLNLTDLYVASNTVANASDGTNGWYAVNKGRLRYPRAFMNAATTVSVGQGDSPADPANDLANSIYLSFTDKQGPDYLRGELYAADRNDIPAGLPSSLASRSLGVWRLPLEKSFSTATLRFRYDRTGVASLDKVRLYRRNASGVWTVVGETTGASETVSTATALTPVGSGDGYLGWFAIMAVEPTGTLIKIY